jgi:hypothetical protein
LIPAGNEEVSIGATGSGFCEVLPPGASIDDCENSKKKK